MNGYQRLEKTRSQRVTDAVVLPTEDHSSLHQHAVQSEDWRTDRAHG